MIIFSAEVHTFSSLLVYHHVEEAMYKIMSALIVLNFIASIYDWEALEKKREQKKSA